MNITEIIHQTPKKIWLFLAVYFVAIMVGCMFFPITYDEAYYFSWGKNLDFGYFDHPPAVAWAGWFNHIFGTFLFKGRLFHLLFNIIAVYFLFLIYKDYHKDEQNRIGFWMITLFSLASLLNGFLNTPDGLLVPCWIMSLYFAAKGISKDARYWLFAGLFTGLGLLSKYTMVLIGPVFLWALCMGHPQQLKSKWPYLGGIVAFLLFSSNILWNAQNDWITFNFQFRHGFPMEKFAMTQGKGESSSVLVAEKLQKMDPTYEKISNFYEQIPFKIKSWQKESRDAELAFNKALSQMDGFLKLKSRFKTLFEFLLGQLGLWGFFVITLAISFMSVLFRKMFSSSNGSKTPTKTETKMVIHVEHRLSPLYTAAAFFPLIFFGNLSLFNKVEANWPAMYLIGMGVFLSRFIAVRMKWLWIPMILHILLLAILISYALNPFMYLNPGFDRILKETTGYSELANYLTKLPVKDKIFTDTYQLTAMLDFYQPTLKVNQIPGATRPSEFVLQQYKALSENLSKDHTKEFYLLLSDQRYLAFDAFRLRETKALASCRDGSIIDADSFLGSGQKNCDVLQNWYLFTYVKSSDQF